MSSRSDAEELLALEADGIALSRNKNYYLFQEEGPRRALNLKRRIDALVRLVRLHKDSEGFSLAVERVQGKLPVELKVTLRVLSATVATRLHADELPLLLREAEVKAALAASGVSVEDLPRRLAPQK